MKKIITLNLFKERRLEQQYKNIKALEKENTLIFIIEGIKTSLNESLFVRETDEYKFYLNINDKKCLYTLKEQNMSFDIEVEKVVYKKEKDNIILEYKISSDEEKFKIVINVEDDLNE